MDPIKLVVAGSRTFVSAKYWDLLWQTIDEMRQKYEISEIVHGGARGIDAWAAWYAQTYHLPLKTFPAYWKLHGLKAGPLRNKEMAEYGDALLAVWDGKSRGTANMIDQMKLLQKPVHEIIANEKLLTQKKSA